MYETEANNRTEPIDQIPAAIQERFRELAPDVLARTVLPWGEHCTECVWPTCYTTCDLYSPREDLKCRRFVDGMVRIEFPGGPNSYLLKIRFKRWGKLWAPGNVQLHSVDDASTQEDRDYRIGKLIFNLPLPRVARKTIVGKRYNFKKGTAHRARPSAELPTSFVVECYNPADHAIGLSLTMRSLDPDAKIPFQKLVDLAPGFQRVRVPLEEISASLNVRAPFSIEMIPNDVTDGEILYFGVMDFVSERRPQQEHEAGGKVKCVVWDLDNTMWDGTLVEDGSDKLRLKPDVVNVIRELDSRGILNSVASKNNFDDAWAVLKKFGIDEFMVYPQISWGPKSDAIGTLAKQLNIGIDTLLFIDDSAFELEQVKSACPDIRVAHASGYLSLPLRAECQVVVTAESAARRKMYQENAVRQKASEGFNQDYLSFLRDCNLEVTLQPLSEANMLRVHELTQRTNQMNFSGRRYDQATLDDIRKTPHLDTYVMDCRDRFGNYGVIGFSIVDRREPRMTDLMFSCRIQSKRVEHAFLCHLIKRYGTTAGRDFWADYRKTPRNAPSGAAFGDIGMEEHETRDGVTSLVFRNGRDVPAAEPVRIIEVELDGNHLNALQ